MSLSILQGILFYFFKLFPFIYKIVTSSHRGTVTAAHSTDDIDRAADILIRTWRALS